MWGDGKQTRSFTYIDDCVEGILRITKSDFKEPLNLGSSEMVSMNGMMETILQFDNKRLPIRCDRMCHFLKILHDKLFALATSAVLDYVQCDLPHEQIMMMSSVFIQD